MSDSEMPDSDALIEVSVYRDGKLAHRERCESLVEAEGICRAWSDVEGIDCRIVDLLEQGEDPDRVLFDDDADPRSP